MVNAFRYGFLGVSDVDIGFAYTIMIGAAVALFTLAACGCCSGEWEPGNDGPRFRGGRRSIPLLVRLLHQLFPILDDLARNRDILIIDCHAHKLPNGNSPAPLCRNSPCTIACTPACSSTCITMCAWM